MVASAAYDRRVPFKLTIVPGVKDTLHREQPPEVCGVDGKAKLIDDETAAALISIGGVRICQRCDPLADAV